MKKLCICAMIVINGCVIANLMNINKMNGFYLKCFISLIQPTGQ